MLEGIFHTLTGFVLKRLTESPIIVLRIRQLLVDERKRLHGPVAHHDCAEFAVVFVPVGKDRLDVVVEYANEAHRAAKCQRVPERPRFRRLFS